MSAKDEMWTHDFYKDIFPDDDLETLSVPAFTQGLRKWEQSVNADPGKSVFGKLERQANGRFQDAELVRLLQESTEDVAGAFGARNVPAFMRAAEILCIEQARSWNVATFNEVRSFLRLDPPEDISDFVSDLDVIATLQSLYGTAPSIELYPGLVAEQMARPSIGQGLCTGTTTSKAILTNIVALVRGDRYYTRV